MAGHVTPASGKIKDYICSFGGKGTGMDATLIGISRPQNSDDLKKLPVLELESGGVIRFQGHHVIPPKRILEIQVALSGA